MRHFSLQLCQLFWSCDLGPCSILSPACFIFLASWSSWKYPTAPGRALALKSAWSYVSGAAPRPSLWCSPAASCPQPFAFRLSLSFCVRVSPVFVCLFVYTVLNNSSLECLVHLHFMNCWYLGVSSTFFPLIYCGFSIFPLSFRLIRYFNLFICFSICYCSH